MLYVSFVEIFVKSVEAYEEEGHEAKNAYTYATLTFFSGFVLCALMNKLVHCLDPEGHHHGADLDAVSQHKKDDDKADEKPAIAGSDIEAALDGVDKGDAKSKDGQVETVDNAAEELEKARLQKMGIMTALAIGIHNFPEGLATFVGTLDDPSVGIPLAIAIGIHNIPEGLCVAIPVYYATGNRWKAFGWALLSGISEPIGAGLGWLVLSSVMSQDLYGFLFGVVGGMMVCICISELIPTAHRYDPEDKVTTLSIVAGMAVMAISLVLFQA